MEQEKVRFYKKKNFWYGVAIFFGIGIIGNLFNPPTPPQPTTQAPVKTEQPVVAKATTTPTLSKSDARKEFDRLMDLSKQAGLVKSYEMSQESPLVIYADSIWYSREVKFKKDMIAKFSMLEDAIYGRNRLEVRDAYSNEKLAEVTAFTGSLEVYK